MSLLLSKLGRMLGLVIKNMVEKANNSLSPAGRKIYLYSGHENNVINILAALNLYAPHVPNYNAAVIIELVYLEETGTHVVRVSDILNYHNLCSGTSL